MSVQSTDPVTPQSKADDANEVSAACGSASLSVRLLTVSTTPPQAPESPTVPLPDPDFFWAAVVTRYPNNTSSDTDVSALPEGSTGTADLSGTEDKADNALETDTALEAGTESTGSTASSLPGTPKAKSSLAPAVFNSDFPNETEATTPISKRDASFLNPEAPTFLPPAESPSFFSRDFTLPDDVSQLDLSDANLPALDLPKVNLPRITVTNHKDKMAVKTTSYHIDADLAVKVQDSHGLQVFKVHSALIAAASPVWRQKIYGGEYARPKTGDWVIAMCDADEDAAGLDIIFSLIHYKYHEIPARPGMSLLHRVAQVASKYNCVHLLVPYTAKWIEGMDWQSIMTKQSGDDYEKALFITWVFGEPCWFYHTISQVAYRATLDANCGNLVSGVGVPLEQYGLPSGLIGKYPFLSCIRSRTTVDKFSAIDIIAKTRANAVSKMLTILESTLDKLLDSSSQGNTTCCRSEDAAEEVKELCQMMQLGSLIRGLTKARMNPIPQVDLYQGSARSLGKQLEDMKVSHYKIPGVKPHLDSHANCGFRGKDITGEAMPEGVNLPGDLIQVLKGTAMRSGAYSADMFDELTTSIREPNYEEGDDSSRLAQDKFLSKIHYKQVEGYTMLSDGLDSIAEEKTEDSEDVMTNKDVIPASGSDEEVAVADVEAPVVDAQGQESSLEITNDESVTVDAKEEVTETSTTDGIQGHEISTRKTETKSKCYHCNRISDEEYDDSVVIKTEELDDSGMIKTED